ncbi:MAG TPA: TIGR03790 family protein, partial [Candidatus Binatia bacterium]|nr:TIGR03790 family protein [Candidatus Binatia bacterium]
PLFVRAGGDEVVVVYNSQMPASKAVAEHYAAVRHVPARQIFGFGLTTNEVMTREDFTDFLQKPLAQKLEDAGLWKFSKVATFSSPGKPEPEEFRVTESKIRYAVLCYGVPLKIAPSSTLKELAGKLMGDQFRRNEASVDSELAWLPRLRMKVPLTGPLPNPLYGCTNRAELNCTNGLLLVSRLDGPTPEIANGLVDKAVEAENSGLWGRAYFDARGLATNDNYYLGDAWMMAGAEICRQLGFEVETDTNGLTLPASFPMSHIAIYAGWYSGEPCGPFTQAKMEFMPGAFAYHLNSFSADTIRSTTRNWCGPLLAKGATCTMGCVYEPYLQFTPNIAEFLQTLGNGYTFGEAAWVSQNALSWQNTVIGDPLYQPFKMSPAELHAQLAREKNPLIEWSFDRIVCLDLLHGMRAPQLIRFLANVPATAHSAVLTEKLATLYDAMGMPDSAIETWQNALKLNPSPQQRLRIRLVLGEKLAARNMTAEAMKNYKSLLAESPGYPGKNSIEDKIQSLEQKLSMANESTARKP